VTSDAHSLHFLVAGGPGDGMATTETPYSRVRKLPKRFKPLKTYDAERNVVSFTLSSTTPRWRS
jgi:hypothetical protein